MVDFPDIQASGCSSTTMMVQWCGQLALLST